MSNFHRVFWSYFGYSLLIFVSCFLMLLNYIEKGNILRSKIMISELFLFRSSVASYLLFNKKLPESLMSAIQFSTKKSDDFVEIPVNSNNNFINPFGKEYFYDSKTGFVTVEDDKYKNW